METPEPETSRRRGRKVGPGRRKETGNPVPGPGPDPGLGQVRRWIGFCPDSRLKVLGSNSASPLSVPIGLVSRVTSPPLG